MSLVHSGASAVIPTGADLNWRTVYPGQWVSDSAGYIWADSLKGGQDTPAQVRGWGYLTGGGSGALGLNEKDAERIQAEVGRLLAAAPDLLDFAKALDASWLESFPNGPDELHIGFVSMGEEHVALWRQCRAAILKATTPAADTQVGTSNASEPKNTPANGDSQ
jgi:hypothetical protein